jgi:hypothetical protein
MGLNQIKGKIIKIAGEPKIRVINHTAYRKQLADLEPGTYEFVIQPVDSKLKQMKKAYFAMEGQLARHLGYKKVQLHSQLKDYIGHHISPHTIYDPRTGWDTYYVVAHTKRGAYYVGMSDSDNFDTEPEPLK